VHTDRQHAVVELGVDMVGVDPGIGRAEQLAGAFEAPSRQVVAGCRTIGGPEGADEVVAGVPGRCRQGSDVDRGGKVPVDEVPGATQASEPGGVRRLAHALSVRRPDGIWSNRSVWSLGPGWRLAEDLL
jgi:hypothetical protein